MNIRLAIVCTAALTIPILSSNGELGQDAEQRVIEDAVMDLKAKRFDAAAGKLLEAQKLDPPSAAILNLLGAVYTKKKDFQTAKILFERSLAREPGFFPAAFNIGELLFLEKQYRQAFDYFSKMLSADPANELLQFKMVLCLLLMGQAEEAEKLLARMIFPGNGPAWYYAQAASQIMGGNRRKAGELLANAQVIFPGKTSLYEETFEDLGWPAR
ncbi:MAG TPA: tetratricopeptide repeat protein [Terrimicrobiaceae bacterium]